MMGGLGAKDARFALNALCASWDQPNSVRIGDRESDGQMGSSSSMETNILFTLTKDEQEKQ